MNHALELAALRCRMASGTLCPAEHQFWVGSLEKSRGFPLNPPKKLNFLQGGQQQPSFVCAVRLTRGFKSFTERKSERAGLGCRRKSLVGTLSEIAQGTDFRGAVSDNWCLVCG